jgi:CBS domain-containing membrane protein
MVVPLVEDPRKRRPSGEGSVRKSPGIGPTWLRVRDLMTSEPVALRPEDDLTALYDLLDTKHVRHVPVVDEDGDLVGLVTHRDLLRCALAEELDLPLSLQRDMLTSKTVGEIMTAEPETVEAETDIRLAAQTMFENKYGCLPVVEGARLVGILTEADFVRYLAERDPYRS